MYCIWYSVMQDRAVHLSTIQSVERSQYNIELYSYHIIGLIITSIS